MGGGKYKVRKRKAASKTGTVISEASVRDRQGVEDSSLAHSRSVPKACQP